MFCFQSYTYDLIEHIKVLFQFFLSTLNILFLEEQAKIEEMRKTVSELDVLLTKINSARLDDGNDENFPDADTDQRAECLSPQWPKRTPDYQLDPVTKLMYLTPLGRRQVGSSP